MNKFHSQLLFLSAQGAKWAGFIKAGDFFFLMICLFTEKSTGIQSVTELVFTCRNAAALVLKAKVLLLLYRTHCRLLYYRSVLILDSITISSMLLEEGAPSFHLPVLENSGSALSLR